MKHSLLAIASVVAGLGLASGASAWPRLDEAAADPRCRQALRLGGAAFASTNASLAWPVDSPRAWGSTPVFYRAQIDISGGDAVAADPGVFSQAGSRARGQVVYFQSRPADGKRLAVIVEGAGWRGDKYSLYLADAAADPATLGPYAGRGGGIAVLDGTWTPPTVLRDDATKGLWFVEYGQERTLGAWRVHALEAGAVRPICRVTFRPQIQSATDGLSPAIRRWAGALDEALGRDGPGTLRPISRTRLAMGLAWENARFRPWALVAAPYNTEAEVEAGLRRWAEGSKARARVYRTIREGRPRAEADLSAYYANRFGLAPEQARRAGAYVADYLFRSSFVFHKQSGESRPATSPNPWPSELRRPLSS